MLTFFFQRRLHRSALPLLIALALSGPWILVETSNYVLNEGSGPARMVLVRWLLSLPCAYWLAVGMASIRHRRKIVLGMVLGALLSLATVYHDRITFDPKSVTASDSTDQPVWIDGQYRASGIFSHPNAAAGVVLIAVPLMIGLIEERRLPWATVIAPIALLGAVYYLTMTRGPTMVAAAIIAIHLLRRSSTRNLAVFAIGIALAALVWSGARKVQLGTAPLVERVFNSRNIEGGAQDRALTTFTSLEIAVTHPFGVGSRYERLLGKATGFTATHNGYVQLALLGGIPLMVFVATSLLGHANPLKSSNHRVEQWAALYIAGALLFENQFFVSTFSVLVLWLAWDPVLGAPAAIPRRWHRDLSKNMQLQSSGPVQANTIRA
jgi:hypothetical protein